MAKGKGDLRYAELFVAVLIFASADIFSSVVPFISESALLLDAAITAIFLSMAVMFILFKDVTPETDRLRHGRHSAAFHAMLFAIVALYLILVAMNPAIWLSIFQNFWIFGVFFVAFLPLFFMMFMGGYLVRTGNGKAAVLLMLAVFFVIVLYYPSRVLSNTLRADDEEVIMFQSVVSLVNGVNPYSVSFSDAVYQNVRNATFTLTTTSEGIMGGMGYPALFFLSFLPFYYISPPTVQNLARIDLPLQESIFIFILLAAIALLLNKKDLLKANLPLMVIFVFTLTNIASVTVYLMLALLLAAYVKLESRYAWVFLGLCVSIQEELWLPVLFLIAYSFNNQGMRRGLTNLAGAAAVFLAFNAYFIILSPSAYYTSVFGPLNSFIFPNGFSSIGFPITKYFPILLSTYPQLFELTALFLVFLLLYWNRKELIPIFSMIPFLVTDHSLYSYYATFMFVLIFAIALKDRKRRGWIEAALRKRRNVIYFAIAAYVLLAAALMYASHAALAGSFGMSASQPVLTIDRANTTSVYRTTLSYGNLSNSTVYVIATAMDSHLHSGIFGALNSSIISDPASCSDYACMVNINRITLPSGGTYNLTARLKWYNDTPIQQVSVQVYNGPYFYFGKTAYNFSS